MKNFLLPICVLFGSTLFASENGQNFLYTDNLSSMAFTYAFEIYLKSDDEEKVNISNEVAYSSFVYFLSVESESLRKSSLIFSSIGYFVRQVAKENDHHLVSFSDPLRWNIDTERPVLPLPKHFKGLIENRDEYLSYLEKYHKLIFKIAGHDLSQKELGS